MPAMDHLPSGLVTFLFTDIEGSTRLAQMLGGGYRPVLEEHRRLLRDIIAAHNGTELFTEGDSFFVAFADASDAVKACLTAQRALAAHIWPAPGIAPKVRMGLHSGYATPIGREYASPEVHRAARVAAAAHGGQVLCSAATARLAAAIPPETSMLDLGLHRLRGFDGRERLFQLAAPGLETDFPRPRTEAAAHNLPHQATTFVGRGAECIELATLVETHRLVTVVGPGGAGKSRLAVETAGGLVERFPDGVWYVDVAPVTDSGLVAFAVAAVLGLRPEPGRPILDTLVESAAGRRMLLVLDTGDAQLAAAAEVISSLLTGGTGAKVLATSREPFRVAGEVVWRIPPLSVAPGPGGAPSDAVALLMDRTSLARGGRAPSPAEVTHLARVAGRLNGLPLAIELAAARLRLLSASQLAERLDDLLGVLDAGSGDSDATVAIGPAARAASAASRNQTMQATVTWSYRTLGPRAARLLRWLSVFAGPVDLPTVEWVLKDDPLDPLAVLVDKSMVQVEPHASGTLYRILDPIKAYGARRLADAGEENFARDQHVDWSMQALQRAHLDQGGLPITLSLYALDPLADEVRAALRWTSTGGSARSGLHLAQGLDQWWRERGLAREGRLWLFRMYGRMAETGEPIPDAELALAYHMHSLHAGADGESAEEQRFAQRAEAHARRSGDPGLLVRVLSTRGGPLIFQGQYAEAERHCCEVIEWATANGVPGDALYAIYSLAELLWRRGALDEAAELLGAARNVEAGRPLERGRRGVDMLLGMIALGRGDLVAAHEHLVVALRSRMGHGFHRRACDTINAMAVRCAVGGDPVNAARLFGATAAMRSSLRSSPGIFANYWTEHQQFVRAVIGDTAFDRAYAEGNDLSLPEAAAAALAIEHPDLTSDTGRFLDAGRLLTLDTRTIELPPGRRP